jgi:hypothetical protein
MGVMAVYAYTSLFLVSSMLRCLVQSIPAWARHVLPDLTAPRFGNVAEFTQSSQSLGSVGCAVTKA